MNNQQGGWGVFPEQGMIQRERYISGKHFQNSKQSFLAFTNLVEPTHFNFNVFGMRH